MRKGAHAFRQEKRRKLGWEIGVPRPGLKHQMNGAVIFASFLVIVGGDGFWRTRRL